MLRLTLTVPERAAVQALRHDRALTPAERDRVEMLLLADAGWSPPRIAAHLGCHAVTVRALLRRWPDHGPACVRRGRPGPAPDTTRRQQLTAALDALLAQERTWTAAQLAAALQEQGFALSTRQTRRYLPAVGARWRRTVHTVAHKQDPERVAAAEADLADLKKEGGHGRPALALSG